MTERRRLIVGISGASGVVYGIRLLQLLKTQADIETHLIMSATARLNVTLETDWAPRDVEALADVVHADKNLAATVSSGSVRSLGMIVAPCSIKTLSAIVNSYTDTLLSRAADVVLKEGRRLVLMPRETPLHAGHCRLLLEAAQMNIQLLPPMPAFYTRPQSVEDLVDQTVGRALDLFDIDAGVLSRWTGPERG